MVRLRDAVGGIIVFFSGIGILFQLRNLIIGEAVKSQTPDFLDFFVDLGTPDLSGAEMINIGIGSFFLIIGLLMIASGRGNN